jgi:hypothetical protein
MANIKICESCGDTIDSLLDDLHEHNWNAFQIPEGVGKVRCFCNKEECGKNMVREVVKAMKKINDKIKRERVKQKTKGGSSEPVNLVKI